MSELVPIVAWIGLAIGGGVGGDGAERAPLTPEELLGRTAIRALSLAPDGGRALVFEGDGGGTGRAELVELEFREPADVTRIVHELPDDAWSNVTWDRTSGAVAFLRAGPPRAEVWLLERGGAPRLALPIAVGCNVFALFFRGRREDGRSELLALHNIIMAADSSRPGRREAVLSRVDLERQELEEPLGYFGSNTIRDATLSPDGRRLAFVGTIAPTFAAEGEPLYLTIRDFDEQTEWSLTQDDTIAARPVFSPDSTRIACIVQQSRTLLSSAKRDVIVFDLAQKTTQCVTADHLVSIGNGIAGDEEPISFLDDRTLLIATQHGMADHPLLVELPPPGTTDPAPRSRFVAFGANSWQKLAVASGTGRLLAVESGPSMPDRVVTATWPRLAPAVVEEPNARLAARPLAKASSVAFRGADEWPMEGLLLTPSAEAAANAGTAVAAPWPTIFLMHGASSGRSTLRFNDSQAQSWAALGYAVFAPNLRGSAGYGVAFNAANEGDFGGKELADLDAAVDELIVRGIADPRRLFLTGHSYGGFLVELAFTRTGRFAAGCAVAGVSDWEMFVDTSDLAPIAYLGLGGGVIEQRELYMERSPLQQVSRMATPLLLVHGERDRRVPLAQSERLAAALGRQGVPCELMRLAQVGHMLRGSAVNATVLRAQDQWFRQHGGPPGAGPNPVK